MNNSIVISSHVIDTLNSLPKDEQVALSSALIAELILKQNAADLLTPVQKILYTVIRRYVVQDSSRIERILNERV